MYEASMRTVIVAASLGLGLAACTEQPARIQVKGPPNTLAAAHGVEQLPVFTEKNATIKLRAAAFDDQDRFMKNAEVEWESRDPRVASVSQTGLVTILSSGETQIVARTRETEAPLEDAIDVKAVIIDGVKITSPAGDEELPKLPMGETVQFEAEVTNDRGEVIEDAEVEWESTTWAATIGVNGEAEGRAIGKATIIATAENGDADRMEIEVTDWSKKRRRRR
jgi:hypothetical protein